MGKIKTVCKNYGKERGGFGSENEEGGAPGFPGGPNRIIRDQKTRSISLEIQGKSIPPGNLPAFSYG